MIEGKSYDLKPYDIVLVNHNDIHRLKVDNSVLYERIIVYIAPGFIQAYKNKDYDLSFCFQRAAKEHSNVLRIPSLEKALFSAPLPGWRNLSLMIVMLLVCTGRYYFWNL